jgi:protein-L-isoaspartate(D-aspartate) O-methyltransferase
MEKLLKYLEDSGVLRTKNIKKAFTVVDRKDFFLEEYKDFAYEDEPSPIGFEQTISQPYTVVFMLELLNAKSGDKVMDIGAGSGWLTALLAEIVGNKGKVYGIELIKELCYFAKSNISKYPNLEKRVEIFCQSADDGLPHISEEINGFDAIIVSAEVAISPQKWRSQLKIGGALVYPKAGGIFKETKISDSFFNEKFYPGFAFVPYIKD